MHSSLELSCSHPSQSFSMSLFLLRNLVTTFRNKRKDHMLRSQ